MHHAAPAALKVCIWSGISLWKYTPIMELHAYSAPESSEAVFSLLPAHACRAVSRGLAYSIYLINASIHSNNANPTSQHMESSNTRCETQSGHTGRPSTWLKPAVDSQALRMRNPLTPPPNPAPNTLFPSPLSPLPSLCISWVMLGSLSVASPMPQALPHLGVFTLSLPQPESSP